MGGEMRSTPFLALAIFDTMSSYENYAETSENYDATRIPMGIEIILGALARAPAPLGEVKLLDAGCGTGSYAAALAEHVGRVTCVDLNEEMLAIAKRKLPDDVVIRQSAIDNLPFDDASFDAVMVNQVLHHIADDADNGYPALRAIFEEFARVLVPGGCVSINTCSHEQLRNGWWYYRLIPEAVRVACRRHIPLDDLSALLRQCGFRLGPRHVPVDALMQGERYFDGKGPLSKAWRDGDSIWACAGEDELERALHKVAALQQSGQLQQFVREHDRRRPYIGQVTFLLADLAGEETALP